MNQIDEIIEHVASHQGFTKEDLIGKSRKSEIVRARFMAMKILRDVGLTFQRIANEFNRDHSSVIHGINQIGQPETWPGADEDMEEIKINLNIHEIDLKTITESILVKDDIIFRYCPNQHLFKTYKMQLA